MTKKSRSRSSCGSVEFGNTKQHEAGDWPASCCFGLNPPRVLKDKFKRSRFHAGDFYFFFSNKWQRLQRTRAFTKQLHFGQRFNFKAILRFVLGRITISNRSCQFQINFGWKRAAQTSESPDQSQAVQRIYELKTVLQWVSGQPSLILRPSALAHRR